MKIRRSTLFALLLLASGPNNASADTFDCVAAEFCVSNHTGIPAGCQKSEKAWTITTNGWRATVDDGEVSVRFREARPYFTRIGLYQAGDTRQDGMVNLWLSNTDGKTGFSISKVRPSSVSNILWEYRGVCQTMRD